MSWQRLIDNATLVQPSCSSCQRVVVAGSGKERGVVTVELVFGMLIVIFVTALFGWAILLFGTQISAVNTAENVARQAARGDNQAVAEAKKQAPQDATISINQKGRDVRVTVRVDARPALKTPTIPIRATAVAQKEPGEEGVR